MIIRNSKIKNSGGRMKHVTFSILEEECFQMMIMLRKWSLEWVTGVEWSLTELAYGSERFGDGCMECIFY